MSAESKSITIVHGLPDTNSGGSALGIALVNVLLRAFPKARLSYVSSHADPEIIRTAYPFILEEHPDLEILPYPVRARSDNYLTRSSLVRKLKNVWWVFATLGSVIFLVFPFLGRWNRTLRHVGDSSVVISRGTQIFYDKKGHILQSLLSKYWLCIPLLYAWRVKVPFVVYAQTIGPIHSPWVRKFMQFVLRKATYVLPREQYSYDYLKNDLEIDVDKIVLVPDSVFGLESPTDEEIERVCDEHQLQRGKFACLVVRHYMEKGSEGQSKPLCDQFVELAKHIIDNNICEQIVVATQCHHLPEYTGFECDSKISHELLERLTAALGADRVKLIDKPLSPREAMCIYGAAKYLVSVRLHAAIFSMISGTPAIAVSYWGSKTRGIFQMLGFDDAFIEKEEMTGNGLIAKLDRIEHDYAGYCDSMAKKVSNAYQQAQQTPHTFAELVSS